MARPHGTRGDRAESASRAAHRGHTAHAPTPAHLRTLASANALFQRKTYAFKIKAVNLQRHIGSAPSRGHPATPRLRVGIRPPASGGRGGGTRGGNDAVKRESGGSPEQSRCCKPPFLRIEHECHCAAHGKAFTPDGEVRRPAGVLQVNHGLEEGRALKKRSIGTSKDSLSHAASHPMGAGNPCPAQ